MTPFITLKRIGTSVEGMPGVMVHNKRVSDDVMEHIPFCVSLERDYKDPKFKPISSGDYLAKAYSSPKYPQTYEIVDLPGSNLLGLRTKILFHPLNFEEQTEGCIGLGEQFGYLNKKFAILQSKKAFNKFMEITAGLKEFRFRVLDWIYT